MKVTHTHAHTHTHAYIHICILRMSPLIFLSLSPSLVSIFLHYLMIILQYTTDDDNSDLTYDPRDSLLRILLDTLVCLFIGKIPATRHDEEWQLNFLNGWSGTLKERTFPECNKSGRWNLFEIIDLLTFTYVELLWEKFILSFIYESHITISIQKSFCKKKIFEKCSSVFLA